MQMILRPEVAKRLVGVQLITWKGGMQNTMMYITKIIIVMVQVAGHCT